MLFFEFINLDPELLQPVDILKSYFPYQLLEQSQEGSVIINVSRSKEGLKVSYKEGRASLSYHKKSEFFRGLGLLCEAASNKNDIDLTEKPSFAELTYMQDNSRNAVSNTKAVKKLIRQLALMGYTSLMLYTEDTYEIEDYPYFGYFRGRFSREELMELSAYGEMFGVELIPCIQTLAHLNAIFQWEVFQEVRDIGDILLCGNDRTYELIESMIKTCSEVFPSKKIHIGMDEAEMLGLGKYLKINGYTKPSVIMEQHLQKVLAICRKYGMHAMMWSDMFFKLLPGNEEYYNVDADIPKEVKDKIPDDVELVYWDYYSREKEIYNRMIRRHLQLSGRVAFAGGAWKWQGFAPLLHHSLMVSKLALSSCKEHHIMNIMVTGWGDNGAETSNFAVGPVLQLYAEVCYGGDIIDENLSRRLYTCTHMDYEDFMKLDMVNLTPDNPSPGFISAAPAKYLFYQDVLLGLYDRHVDAGTYPRHYGLCHTVLSAIAAKDNEYGYIFDTLAKLAHVLELKCDMGIRLKAAYDRKDTEKLKDIAETECPELIRRIESFHEAFRHQWYLENKPFGFDAQDIRIGGLKERLRAVTLRVREYLDGTVSRIEELEQERLPLDERENLGHDTLPLDGRENPGHDTFPLWHNDWRSMVTVSVL